MKKILFFGALAMMFMGCPYQSKVPIDDASKAISDKDLVGKWEQKDDENYEWNVTLDGTMYSIEKKDVKDTTVKPEEYKGYLVTVNGSTFFNVYQVQDDMSGDDIEYYFYRVEKKGTERVRLQAVTGNITETFATSADLKAFITKYMGLSFFYDKDEEKTFYKND